MSLFTESYGTVFTPDFQPKGKSYILKTLSISDGKGTDGKTVYSYWNAHFIGKAKEDVSSLPDKSNIKFKAYVKKHYNKETKKEYNFLQVFEFELATKENTPEKESKVSEPVDADLNIADEDLPF